MIIKNITVPWPLKKIWALSKQELTKQPNLSEHRAYFPCMFFSNYGNSIWISKCFEKDWKILTCLNFIRIRHPGRKVKCKNTELNTENIEQRSTQRSFENGVYVRNTVLILSARWCVFMCKSCIPENSNCVPVEKCRPTQETQTRIRGYCTVPQN